MTATGAARRPSSLSRAALVAVTFLGLAALLFWGAVRTAPGQRVDQWLLEVCRMLAPVDDLPRILQIDVVTSPLLWLVVAVAVVTLVQCRRFRSRTDARHGVAMTGMLLAFAPLMILLVQFLRDHVLTRPMLYPWVAETANSAPSGHAAAVTAIVVVLALATPPVLRPGVIVVGGTWAAVLEFGLVASGWHRPSDVILSTLLVAGIGVLLPDPWHSAAHRTPPRWTLASPVLIAVATPVIVAISYPTITQVAAAGAIATVMAVAMLPIGFGRRSAPRTEARPPTQRPHRSLAPTTP